MDFDIGEEYRAVQETARRFVEREMIPLEPTVIRREAERGFTDAPLIPPEAEDRLRAAAKEAGLYGIDVPERFGGQDLGLVTKAIVFEQMRRSIVPFVLPPESPNLHLLAETCKGSQIDRYLLPYARGEKRSCIAISEPGAGSDAGGIRTRAERRNGRWVLNGQKIWISNAAHADFIIVMAVTDASQGTRGGMTAFLVDKGMRGLSVPTCYPMIGEYAPYAVNLDDVELDDEQVLGEVGQAFVPISRRLGVRRMEIAARCLGVAGRCIEMMLEQAKQRSTFGTVLADRQAVQFWISDSWQELEMCRLVVHRLAWRMDRGREEDSLEIRREGAMAKVQCTEMATRVVDRAIQLFGGMGLSKLLPLEYMARVVRVWRIVEGPSEVHRWLIARDLLKGR
ncbi:acyl-CoA dehydrogenase family protein [Sabulicella glaciei]|uniref:Medium-chain specific acyl-CoA dehydrogenase, mitochondrial n=1 Tax=Sabulicella glaciei TaxID=2984948 RepID=A0ABT3NTU3_9PROT|nr:acyl-CoA dehydrogenase [Roseococcus sp. MDT2-1-1]MCW8085581.1 acyl-CoA dehydrogenase [Roseococcus sp. MDT2-1-1]